MPEIANVHLKLVNLAENVLLVRQSLSGLAEAVGLDPIELNDISTAVSEACNNVVVHAYEGGEGPLEVDIRSAAWGLEVIVRDRGVGIRPREPDPDMHVGGIGLPVMLALASRVEFRDLDGQGTEVWMHFPTTRARELELPEEAVEPLSDGEIGRETASISVGPAPVARAVLPRVLCALAARASFTTDRISDTQILADALVAHAADSLSASRLSVQISVAPRSLQLNVGPLMAGRAQHVLKQASVDGLGSILERLTDGHEVSHVGTSELLGLSLVQRDTV